MPRGYFCFCGAETRENRQRACCCFVCFCLQLEETQTKRHDQLVEQYNELLQEIQDLKPKVLLRGLFFAAVVSLYLSETKPRPSLLCAGLRAAAAAGAAAASDFSPTRSQISADVNSGML